MVSVLEPIIKSHRLAKYVAELNELVGQEKVRREAFREWLDEDKKAVAAMVSYPFATKIGAEEKSFEDAKAFIAAYDDIFTPATLLAIKNQTYETLFANAQGVMFGGGGEVWASEIMSDDPEPKSQGIKIIAINHL